MLFDEINKSIPLETNPKVVSLSMNAFNINHLKDKLLELDKLADEEVYDLITKTYRHILDDIFIGKNVELIRFIYTNPRFIMNLGTVLSKPENNLTYTQKICCNKLAYDYFSANCEKDEYLKALLLNLIKIVNRADTPGLLALGLNDELVSYITNARYSTAKDHVQVKRINRVLLHQSPELITIQMVVDIYGKLYDKITPLFTGIMYDYHPKNNFANSKMEDIYATITVATFEILNNLPYDIMYHLLRNFTESHELINSSKNVRFDIYSFSENDYPRLAYTLEALKKDNIYVPRPL